MSKKGGFDYKMFSAKAVKGTAPVLAIAGWLATMVPTMAITASYSSNDFRTCAGQLLRFNISPTIASQACASALRPRDLSSCVVAISKIEIKKQKQFNPVNALSSCSLARRPEDLATCVVGISNYPQEAEPRKEEDNNKILNYCGRSLLPMRFGQCVVGLRTETKSSLIPILDTCLNGSDTVSSSTPAVVPQVPRAIESLPNSETAPTTR
jgi:hypothetical protein